MDRTRKNLLWVAALVALLLAAATAAWQMGRQGTEPALRAPDTGTVAVRPTPASGLPTVDVRQLPKEAAETLALIDRGGPFPYDKDGSVFGNFEGLLPKQPRGYYREYTVTTPGSRDRGARRIVAGEGGDVYYTSDHYESFRQVLR